MVVQLVQPVAASMAQVCRWPWAVHTAAPLVQALRQQVAVLAAMLLSAVVSALALVAMYEVPVPPALAIASSTTLSFAEATDAPKPTTNTLMPAFFRAAAAATVALSSRQSLAPRPQQLLPLHVLVLRQPAVVVWQVAALFDRLQLGSPSVMSSTCAGAVRPSDSR